MNSSQTQKEKQITRMVSKKEEDYDEYADDFEEEEVPLKKA